MSAPPIKIPYWNHIVSSWRWAPNPGNGRGGVYVAEDWPESMGPKSSASWDAKDGHWDVDYRDPTIPGEGRNVRKRFSKDGRKSLSAGYAHQGGSKNYNKGWGKNGIQYANASMRHALRRGLKKIFKGIGKASKVLIIYTLATEGVEAALKEVVWWEEIIAVGDFIGTQTGGRLGVTAKSIRQGLSHYRTGHWAGS